MVISSCRCLRALQTPPPDRPGFGSARREHHGILQGVQRGDHANLKRACRSRPIITVYGDKSFSFVTKIAASNLPDQESGQAEKGSKEPGKISAGTITRSQLTEIAEIKMKDLNANRSSSRQPRSSKAAPARWASTWWRAKSWRFQSKKAKALATTIDREKLHGVDEAIALVKANATSKFDETIEVALNLGVDPRHADQMVRGVVTLPKGTGKTVRVAVFAKDAKAEEAKAAGADVVGAEDLLEIDARAARSSLIAASRRQT